MQWVLKTELNKNNHGDIFTGKYDDQNDKINDTYKDTKSAEVAKTKIRCDHAQNRQPIITAI